MSSYSNSGRKRSHRLLLVVLALGMAMVSVMLVHKLREGRLFGLLLQDQDRQIMTLQVLLQRERGNSKEMKRKLEDMKAKDFLSRIRYIELANKLSETQTLADHLQKTRSEMETSLETKQNQIEGLAERAQESIRADLRVAALTDLLKQKETEVEEMKQQLQKLGTEVNNTTQSATSETPADFTEVTEDSNANEAKNEENKAATKREWMQLQTNVDDDASKDSGEASDDHQAENPTNSKEKKSSEEGKEMSKEGASEEQSKETKNGEGKTDSEASEEKEAEKTGETEVSQESATDIQEASNDMEKSELVAAQVVEQEKLENPQDGGNEQQLAPEEPTKDTATKEHKVRRRKSRGKGRRQRRATGSIKEGNRGETRANNEVGDGQKKQAVDDPSSEVHEGSQVAGSGDREGQHNSRTVAGPSEEIPVSSNQQLEEVQSQEDDEGSKVPGDSSTAVTQEEENERTSTQESEIPRDEQGKNENNVEKQGTKEEVGSYTNSISTESGGDDTSAGKAEGLKVQEKSTDKTFEEEHAEKPETAQRVEAKADNIDETRASAAEKDGAAENQNGMVEKEGGGNTASITEQEDTINAASEQQTSQK